MSETVEMLRKVFVFGWAILLCAALMFSACSMPSPAGAPPVYEESRSVPNESLDSSADSSRKSRQSVHAPAVEAEPGLGTKWGRNKSSKLSYTSFSRTQSDPYGGVAQIFYNDKEGVEAMTRRSGYVRRDLVKAADGVVEWGVKQGWSVKSVLSGGRRYVVGREGASYSILVKNLCHCRVEAVVSVDGLSVVDGEAASLKKQGYVIEPGGKLEIKGFRISEDKVAAFKFSSVRNSYSARRHGTTQNVGVIGLAVYTEKGRKPWRWSRPAVDRRHGAEPFAGMMRFNATNW